MRNVISMFTIRQKLLLCGSVLFSVLLVAGGYFGSRWLHGADVETSAGTPAVRQTALRKHESSCPRFCCSIFPVGV